MTGPAGTSSSPDKAHPPSQPPPQGGISSGGSGSIGGAEGRAEAGGGGGPSLSPLVRTRPVTRSSAAMSSGKRTRQRQQSENAAVSSPPTPSGDSKHRHSRQHQQRPTTPKGASSTPTTSRKGEASVATPPPTAAASTSARSPETTARSTGSVEPNTTPTPTSPANAAGGASHHYHTRHSHHPPASSTQHQHQESPGGGNPNTRKRSAAAASIDTTTSPSDIAENYEPRIDRLSLTTPTTANTNAAATSPTSYRGSGGGGGGAPEWICLCTKEPKVPRPRNAFILYRQHHQQQTVAANPGTANPEISKIIGNKWKNEPEERKDEWRRLADEEKHQHALRYPDYKYQPRRSKSGKGGGESAVQTPVSATFPSSEGGPGTCPKCGGRYISTPRTPSTPFAPSSGRFSSGSRPASSMSSTPGLGTGGSDPWGDRRDGPPRRDPRQSIDSATGGDYYGRPPPPQYQYGLSAPGLTPYPLNYRPQQGGPGGGGYPPYPSNNEREFRERERERDRMINNRGWPPPGTPGGPPPPPSAYDQQPPHPFRDRGFDIREAEYEGGMTPVAASPSEAKRRRYNPDYYQRQEHQQPLPSPPPPPPMGGYGGPPPPLPRPQPMDYGYQLQGPPPPPSQFQSPHPRSSMPQSSVGPSTSGPGPQPPPMGRSTPTMGPPPPPPYSRGGSVSVGATAPGYHTQPSPPPASSSSRGSRGGRETSHTDAAEFESLRLPPLQTHLPRPGQSSARSPAPHAALSGGGGIGAVCGPGSSANSPMNMDISSATPTGISMPGGLNIFHGDRKPDRIAPPRPESASLIDPALHPGGGGGERRASIPPPLGKPVGPPSCPTATPTRAPAPLVTPSPVSIPRSGPPRSQAQQNPRTESNEEKSAQGPMIMSISYLQKLAQFERIINPLSAAAPYQQPTSGATRGPIIAVEGTNPRLMKQVARAVERALERTGTYEVKKWIGPASVEDLESPPEKEQREKKRTPAVVGSGSGAEAEAATSRRGSGTSAGGDDVAMADAAAPAAPPPGSSSGSRSSSKTPTPAIPVTGSAAGSTSASPPAAGDVTSVSASIRGSQPPQAPGSASRTGSISSIHTQKSLHSGTSNTGKALTTPSIIPTSNTTSIPTVWQEISQWHTTSLEMVNFVTKQSHDTSFLLTPVAVLPAGYTLTHANRHACSTPITDAYAPIDHWRWMASLWRGVVAPDLTIYVLDQKAMDDFVGIEDKFSPGLPPNSHPQTSPSSVVSAGGGAASSGGGQGQTVGFKRAGELRGDVLVVRLAGEGVTGAELLDKTERRVGFEVNEWVNEWCTSALERRRG